jgi:putative ABC transport system permease protein
MPALHRWRAFLRNVFRRVDVDRELDRELQAYADLVADERIRAGAPPEEARRQARVALGGRQQVTEEVRRVRTGAWVDELERDVRYAFRGLRRSPVFAVTAVVTLALGIGANTAMFSVIDALLFKPLPVPDPDRLAAAYRGHTDSSAAFAYPEFQQIAERTGVVRSASAWGASLGWLRDSAATDRVSVHTVSPNYFGTLGVSPALGGAFPTVNDAASRGFVVISDRLWRTRFAAAPSIVGRGVNLNGHALSILGVAPAGFVGLDASSPADLWITFATLATLEPEWNFRAANEIWLNVIVRLQDHLSPDAAAASMPAVSSGQAAAERIRLVAASTPIFDPAVRASTTRLSALVGAVSLCVLLIASANVANLLLVRGTARAREVGVRLAIGASRARLARQMMVESGVLALTGCAAGLLVAHWTIQAVVAFAPRTAIPAGITVAIDGRVVLFAVLVSVGVTMICGLAPAWQSARVDVLAQMKGGPSAFASGQGSLRFRRGLAVAQVALSTVLLVGAGLFVRTLLATLAIAPGYDVNRVLLTTVDFTAARLAPPHAGRAAEEVLTRVRALPGVEAAAFGQIVPFSGAFVMRPIVPAGTDLAGPDAEDRFLTPYGVVSEGYFATLGMPLRGRDFSAADTAQTPLVAIVNETLARRYWPNQDAIGRRLTLPIKGKGPELEVIGVVRDSKFVELTEAQHPFVYIPLKQMHRPRMTLHVRAAAPGGLIQPVRAAIRTVSPDLPAINPITLSEYLARSTAQPRVVSRLLVIFAVVALIVATVGIYGVTAYTVARRSKELGIRVALGARPVDVLRMLVSQNFVLVIIGIGVGLGAALLLAGVVRSLLFGVSPHDPVVFTATTIALMVILLLATLVPARRATRVDPLVVLRND